MRKPDSMFLYFGRLVDRRNNNCLLPTKMIVEKEISVLIRENCHEY